MTFQVLFSLDWSAGKTYLLIACNLLQKLPLCVAYLCFFYTLLTSPSRVPFQPLTCPTVHGARAPSTLDIPAGLSVSVSVEYLYVCLISLSVSRPSPAAALANLGRRQLSAQRLFAKIFNNKQPKTPTSTLGLNLRQLVNILCK